MIRPTKILDPLLPILLLVHQPVYMIIDLTNLVLTKTSILDRRHLFHNLLNDRLPPLLTFRN